VKRRDDWYETIKRRTRDLESNLTRSVSQYPHSEALSGVVEFNYENNDGFHRFGLGKSEFLVNFCGSSNTCIQVVTDSTNVSIALAPPNATLASLVSAEGLDFSSRIRRPKLERILIAENHHSRYAAFKLKEVESTSHGHDYARAIVKYWILDDGTSDFSVLA